MISLKRYLESEVDGADRKPEMRDMLTVTMAAYRSALSEMGRCGVEACPALGGGLKESLSALAEGFTTRIDPIGGEASKRRCE